ncbi:platelet glycoprotein Ib alpha chain-like [Lutzomyia longipalpis]|uniref:platelet glycoprotein Ib alpha chain-like n=1 Tax=Lutzomyia longipalpis TaxID=7200 RepID=UPI002483918A|nr:platelet glycoprotein Ib alpha chain-like [Lutzomyia longipalpis]
MRVIVIILATLVAQGYSQQRWCYICENCNDPFNSGDHERQQCTADNVFPQPGPPGPGPTTTPEAPLTTTQPTLTPSTEPPADTPPPGPPADGTPTTTLFPPTPGVGPGDVPLLRRRRNASLRQDPSEEPAPTQEAFRCFVAHREVAGNRQTQRGCTLYMGEDTCAALGVTGDNCRVCNSDGCNSGTRFTLSILTLIAALFIAIRLH